MALTFANVGTNSVAYYVPLTITNSQSTATPSPFQQMVTVNSSNYSKYLASNLQNINFQDGSGNILNSWLESGNSNTSTSTIYWVKLPNGIPANSSVTIYYCIYATSVNAFNTTNTGIAPNLTSTYGQYDTGSNVFSFYDNFVGTSLKSTWSIFFNSGYSAGNVTVNNGLTLSGGTNWWGLENLYQVSMPSVLEFYGENTEPSGYGITPGIETYNGVAYLMRKPPWYIQNTINGIPQNLLVNGGTANFNVWYLVSGIYNSGSLSLMVNYSVVISQYSYSVSSSNLALLTFENSTSVFQWVRVRAYPPNGVMPSISTTLLPGTAINRATGGIYTYNMVFIG